MSSTKSQRLLALDVLRGITIAGMILVNTPGSWSYVFAPLKHASWIGLTPTDLVFPFFMFIMGISTYISLRKYKFEFSLPVLLKILKRTLVIFAIGVGICWFALICQTHTPFPFEKIRILGVMQRLALAYGATAIIALIMKHKYIPYLIAVLLAGYFIILITGNGFAYDTTNVLSIVDRAVLSDAHLLWDNGIDPEGVLSTIPSIAHVLIGFCVGKLLMERSSSDSSPASTLNSQLIHLFLIGTILTFAGFLLSYGCPISKKIWTPTFTLVTCGLASSFLGLLVWIIDVKGKKGWSRFFEAFGVNPLFMYVFSEVLAIALYSIPATYHGEETDLYSYFFACLQPIFGNYGGSLAFSLLFIGFNWIIGYILFKKKIYIKI